MKATEEPKARLRRLPRWLFWCLGGLAMSYLTYVVAIALFLHWGGLEMLSLATPDVEMSVESGYSWVPGVFVVRGAEFRTRDYDIDLAIVAEQATLSWAPLAAFAQTLEFDELEATGVSFRLLHRVEDTPRQRKRAAHFPELSHRGPFYEKERPPFSPMPFRVRLSHIDADLNEVWISEYRTKGVISAEGTLTIDDEFEVADARVSLKNGSVFVGERQAIAGSECRIAAQVGPFSLRDADVHSVFETIDGRGTCHADLEDLSNVDVYVRERPIEVAGTGRVAADVSLRAGRLVDTTVETDLQLEELRLGRGRVAGLAKTWIESDGSGHVRVRVEQKKGRPLGEGPDLLQFENLDIVLSVDQELVTQPKVTSLDVSVERFSHGDSHLFADLIEPGLPHFTTTHSRLDLSASFEGGEDSTWCFDAKTNGGAVLYFSEGRRVSCQQEVDFKCQGRSKGSLCTFQTAACEEGELHLSDDVDVPFAVRATAAQLSIREGGGWDVDISLAGANPKKALQALVGKRPLERLGVSLLPLGPISGELTLSQSPGAGDPPIVGSITSLKTGAVSGRGRFVVEEGFSSRFLVRSGPMTAGIEQDEHGVRVHPFAGKDFLEED